MSSPNESVSEYFSELFQNVNRNQINIAIVGAVSAGKSTLLNTVFASTYSHCKIKRTTMTPQIYYEYDGKKLAKTSKSIKEENKAINELLIKKTEAQEPITINDIKEAKYIVPKMYNLTSLVKGVYLSVYDIPGLNDTRTKDLYFQYLETNFYKFDIILFVVDINSALNTSDETEILTKIVTNCKANNEKYGIHNKLIILANKCDEMSLDGENQLQLEEEHYEMFEQINTQAKQTVEKLYPKLEYTILPISSEDSYIYRVLEQNPETELDMKYLNKFGSMEFGRTRWNKLTDEKKKIQFKKLMRDWDMESTLTITGFNGFRETLNKFLTPNNQKIFVNNHIIYEIKQITGNQKVDITEEVQLFYKYYLKYKTLKSRIKSGIDVMSIFCEHFTTYLTGYKTKVLDGFIDTTKTYCDATKGTILKYSIKNESFITQIEESKNILDNMVRLFNGDIEMISTLSSMVNDTLTQFYTHQIDSKSKPIKTLYNYIKSLLGFNVKITTQNIDNFFENPDILNNSARDIIKYIDQFEAENIIDRETKLSRILDVLIKIYRNIGSFTVNSEPSNEFMKRDDYPSYIYYADKFWTKFIMFNDDYDPKIDELGFLCKMNIPHRMLNNQATRVFNANKNDLLVLENYYVEIFTNYINSVMVTSTSSVKADETVQRYEFKRNVPVTMIQSSSDNDEDLGGDIDRALGLVSA